MYHEAGSPLTAYFHWFMGSFPNVVFAYKLVGAGYRVEYITYYMASIFPLVWLGRRLRSLRRRNAAPDVDGAKALASGELRVIPVVNGLLAFLLSLEAPLIARQWHLPMGTSLIVMARIDSASGE